MADTTTIRVNFGRPMPVFPLHVAVLMPHAIAPLEIFEPRYRQMVSDALDGPGLIAMAMFAGGDWKQEYHGRPPIRPVVCVGHIAEHFKYPDGRYAIILQGICRGRILQELPASETKLYREAIIEPVGVEAEAKPESAPEAEIPGTLVGVEEMRDRLTTALRSEPLSDLRLAKDAVEHLANPEIPTSVIIEFLGANLPGGVGGLGAAGGVAGAGIVAATGAKEPRKVERGGGSAAANAETEARYQWLAAADPRERAKIVTKRLDGLADLLRRAAPQRRVATPKGCCWN